MSGERGSLHFKASQGLTTLFFHSHSWHINGYHWYPVMDIRVPSIWVFETSSFRDAKAVVSGVRRFVRSKSTNVTEARFHHLSHGIKGKRIHQQEFWLFHLTNVRKPFHLRRREVSYSCRPFSNHSKPGPQGGELVHEQSRMAVLLYQMHAAHKTMVQIRKSTPAVAASIFTISFWNQWPKNVTALLVINYCSVQP